MLCRMDAKSRRIAAGLLGILILAAALFSAVYIAAEADHDCAGDDCAVCAAIRLCTDFLNRLGRKADPAVHTVLPVPCVLLSALVLSALLTEETPVSGKVRLNN